MAGTVKSVTFMQSEVQSLCTIPINTHCLWVWLIVLISIVNSRSCSVLQFIMAHKSRARRVFDPQEFEVKSSLVQNTLAPLIEQVSVGKELLQHS